MHNMNLPKVTFSKDLNVNAVISLFYFKKDELIAQSREAQPLADILPREAGATLIQKGENFVNVFLCVSENEKQIEKKIAATIAGLPEKLISVSVDLTNLTLSMWDKISLNNLKLVAEIMIASRTKWTAKKVEKTPVNRTVFIDIDETVLEKDEKRFQSLGQVQAWVQSLVAMPANYLTPKQFAQEVDLFLATMPDDVRNKVTFDVMNEKQIQEQKMGSFWSVAMGSKEPPRFLELQYHGGRKNDSPYVFVGKGVTFDTGGISLKPSKGMGEMKGDMAGAASACAILFFAALANLPLNVVTLAPCCENMPDGKAVKPGDVVTAMNGKTIEITNTDAEGRLILADALVYSQKFNGKYTIDIATLTGACITALGYEYTGMFTDNEKVASQLIQAGKTAKDWVWQLPMDDELHKSMLRSAVADMANSSEGAGGAGSTNGAIFLKEFAPKDGWVHLDIAGVSEVRGSAAPTGRPVPMLANFLLSQLKK